MKPKMLLLFFAIVGMQTLANATTVTVDTDRSLSATELDEIVQSKELVKSGDGTLTLGDDLSSFAGTITIKTGACRVTSGSALTSVTKVTVENGGALVYAATSANQFSYKSLELHLAGSGTTTYPGAWVNDGKSIQYGCSKLILDADATFAITDNGTNLGVCWGQIKLEGHTLIVNTPNENKRFMISYSAVTTAGNIDVVTGAARISGGSNFTTAWAGDANNMMTVRKGATLWLSNSYSPIPWTLNLENGSAFNPDGTSGFQNLAVNRWSGPINVQNGSSYVGGTWTVGTSLVFGPLIGSGLYRWWAGWIYLDGETGTGTGSFQFSGNKAGGLCINRATAITSASAGINLYDGALTLPDSGNDDLPALTLQGDSSSQCSVTGGKGVLASLYKTGSNTEYFDTRLCVTGLTEIAGGTLKLAPAPANGKPGLSVGWCSPDSPGSEWWTRNTYTNRTALAIEHAYANYLDESNDFNGYTFATYTGTIWNNTEETLTWTIAAAMETGVMIYGCGLNSWSAFGNNGLAKTDMTLQPGANSIEIRLYRGSGICPRYKLLDDWPKNFGVVVDRQGRGTLDSSYFEKLEDPGDGSLFTCGPRSEIVSSDYRVSFTDLKMSGGTLDLNDRTIDFPVAALEGVGTIANGICTVTNEFRVASSAALSGGIVFSNADLILKAGASLTVDKSLRFYVPAEGVVVATATGDATITLPGTTLASSDGMWRVQVDADGNLRLFCKKHGFSVIFR